jgi:hypothetical protein
MLIVDLVIFAGLVIWWTTLPASHEVKEEAA